MEPSENRNGRHGIFRRAGVVGTQLPPGRNHFIDLPARNDYRLVVPPGRYDLDRQHRFGNVFGQFVLPARRNRIGADYHRKPVG